MNIARATLKVFAAKAGASFLAFLGITIFVRQLPQAEMGVFFLFQSLIGILSIPSDLGIRDALEKRISEGQADRSVYTTALLLKIILLLAISIGLIAFKGPINQYLGGDYTWYLVIAVIVQEIFLFNLKVLNSELRVGETGILRFSRTFLWVVIAEVLILYGEGVVGLIYGLVVSFAIVALWAWLKQSTTVGLPSIEKARSLFEFSKYSSILKVGGSLYSWTDILLIGFFLSQSHVAIYEIAWRVSLIVLLLSDAIGTTIFPQISQWDAHKDFKSIENIIHKALLPSLLFTIPAVFGVAVLSQEILSLVFGAEYTTGWLILIILMINTVVQAVHTVVGQVLPAMDRPDMAAKATVVSAAANTVLNVVLIWQFGILGAAVATVAASALGGYITINYVYSLVSVQIPYQEISWCFFASGVMALALLTIQTRLQIDTLPVLLAVIVIGVVIYGSIVLTVPKIRNQLKQIVVSASE